LGRAQARKSGGTFRSRMHGPIISYSIEQQADATVES
jgi:hypothetical protein